MVAIIIILLLCLTASVEAATIDTLPANQWYQVPSSHLASVGYSPSPGGSLGGIMDAWSGGAYDTSRDRLIIWGGGHSDYAGNEFYVFNAVTLAWTRLNNPSTNVGGTESTGLYPDGLPRSRHTYDYILYVPSIDRFCAFGGAGLYPSGQIGISRTDCFNFNNLTWEQKSNHPSGGGTTMEAVYDSGTGLVWTVGGSGGLLVSWNPLTDTYTTRAPTDNFMQSFGLTGAIDTTRHKFVAVGDGVLYTWDLTAGGNIPRVVQSSSGTQTLQNCNRPGFVYVATQDRFYGWCGGTSLYTLNPTTFAWTQVTPAGGNTVTPTGVNATGTFGRFQYIPSHGAFVVVNSINEDVYIFKLATSATYNVGALTHDGPATPEQLSLYLPTTGTVASNVKGAVRYKPSASSTWAIGHPLYRIRPTLTSPPDVGAVPDAFAWPIIDLTPGTAYDVEVTLSDGATQQILTGTFTTRALPATCGAANKTITAGSSSATIQTAFNGLVAGDVVQFQNGTYNLSGLQLDRKGTSGSPICIRGQSRAGTIVSAANGRIFYLLDASYITIENMTLQGNGTDPGLGNKSVGLDFYGGSPTQINVTMRNVTMTGVDIAVTSQHEVQGLMIYDNVMAGNNTWTMDHYAYGGSGAWAPDGIPDIAQNLTWDDDGIALIGQGNVAFNNTLSGFGDTLTFSPGGNHGYIYGNHFYRNSITSGGDDGIEADYSHRNNTLYDNRFTNTMTFVSLDPLYGGPFLVARNISINTGRTAFKWNSGNSGQFIYNNTIVATDKEYQLSGCPQCGAWYQANNGDQVSFGYRNNLFVFRTTAPNIMYISARGFDPLDWDHNSWYPATLKFVFQDANYDSLALLQAGTQGTATIGPVFSTYTNRFTLDNGTTSNPWTTTVTLGANYRAEVTTQYTPAISSGDAAKNSGVAIANITDGYSGAAPDRGAVIAGRATVIYGDRNTIAAPSGVVLSRRRIQ